jgi:hypothetical protein
MLMETRVPVRAIARGLLAVAKASRRRLELLSWVTDRDVVGLPLDPRELKIRALVAELEERVLMAEEIPGDPADPFTVKAIEALRQDEPEFHDWWNEFSLRALHESGVDIVPLLQLECGKHPAFRTSLAVSLGARRACQSDPWSAFMFAATKAVNCEFMDELLDLLGDDEFVARWRFAERHGACFAMSLFGFGGLDTGEPEPIWDAALALANEEEGLVRERAMVGEPAETGVFAWRLARSPPEKQRQMLNSMKVQAGVLALLRVGVEAPELMLKWLVERVDAQLPWAELSDALRGFAFRGRASPARYEAARLRAGSLFRRSRSSRMRPCDCCLASTGLFRSRGTC